MTIYRQTLTLPDCAATTDVGALHRLVMYGYRHVLNEGYPDARHRLDSLFIAQRDTPTRTAGEHPVRARKATKVLVQANSVGDWSKAEPDGITVSDPITTDFSLNVEDRVEIRVTANPTRSLGNHDTTTRGRRVVLRQPNDVAAWLTRTMAKHGLALDPNTVTVGSLERLHGTRKGSHLNFDVMALRGSGVVTDPAEFSQALVSGIGRGKAYGAGMIRHRKVS